jgi:hypothetical protein
MEVEEGRLRVLLVVFLFGLEVVDVVVAKEILSGCMRRTCWMKRSLRLKSLWVVVEEEEGLGVRVLLLLLLLLLVLWLLRVLVSGGHKSHRQNPRRKCWVAAWRFHSFFALKEEVQP